jgi:hypothetical protein
MRKIAFCGSRNSISGRSKAAWIAGTKIFMETEVYSSGPASITFNTNGNTSNRGVCGYAIGGDYGGPSRRAWKFNFAGEFEIFLGLTALVTARAYLSNGGSNFGVAGYTAGGLTSGYAATATAEKVNYSTDIFSSIAALPATTGYLTAFSNTGSAVYDSGGFRAGYLNTVTKRLFSNDTVSTITSMAVPRQYPHSFSNHGTAGYVAGGQNTSSTRTNSIEKYVFSNDSRSTLGATLSDSPYASQGASFIGVRGYSMAGSNAANNAPTNRMDRITYSNDTRSTLTSLLAATWYGGVYENG